jgi:arylsulfatase A-like enzyme
LFNFETMRHSIITDNSIPGMVTAIDKAVETIKNALDANGMTENTIIIFSSDNGGQPISGAANNLPLRGGKNTWFEGGMRVPSFVYSPLFAGSITPNTINDWYYRGRTIKFVGWGPIKNHF